MTNKDVLKMLLISIQYVYDIKIDSYKTEDGTCYYEAEGYNSNDERFSFEGYGFLDAFHNFLKTMEQYNVLEKCPYGVPYLNNVPLKTLLNDDEREQLYTQMNCQRS